MLGKKSLEKKYLSLSEAESAYQAFGIMRLHSVARRCESYNLSEPYEPETDLGRSAQRIIRLTLSENLQTTRNS